MAGILCLEFQTIDAYEKLNYFPYMCFIELASYSELSFRFEKSCINIRKKMKSRVQNTIFPKVKFKLCDEKFMDFILHEMISWQITSQIVLFF